MGVKYEADTCGGDVDAVRIIANTARNVSVHWGQYQDATHIAPALLLAPRARHGSPGGALAARSAACAGTSAETAHDSSTRLRQKIQAVESGGTTMPVLS
jgi:hypothetical protein